MLPQDAFGNKLYFFILCHFNLRFRVKINDKQLWAVVFKNNYQTYYSTPCTGSE